MASSFLGTLYNITDMAWIGILGSKAVAGVGVGGMFTWLSQGLAAMSRMGGQVNTAQACGRKDYDQARSYAAGSLQLTALSGILFAAVCVIFIQPLLGFFNLTDAETYTAAKSYTLITCGLILFSYLNLTLTGLSTAQGDSRTPLLANFIGLAGNMILDPLLILGIGPFPRLEVAGAAIATVLAQLLSMLGCFAYTLLRHSELRLGREDWRVGGASLLSHLRQGLPLGLQFSILAVGIIVMQGAVVRFDIAGNGIMVPGTPAQNGFSAANKLINFLMALYLSLIHI